MNTCMCAVSALKSSFLAAGSKVTARIGGENAGEEITTREAPSSTRDQPDLNWTQEQRLQQSV